MEEAFAIKDEGFIGIRNRRNFSEEKTFQDVFWCIIKVLFQILLILSFLFFLHEVYMSTIEDPYFSVKEIEVKGYERLSPDTIISMAKIENLPNIFTLNLNDIAKRLELNPWIENIDIRKIFPDKILIQIEERKPMAIVHLEKFYYIDSNGVIFSPVSEMDKFNLPILTGIRGDFSENGKIVAEDLAIKAIEFLKILEKTKTSPIDEISEIHMDRYFGIHCISLNEGIEIRMGWDNFEEKLKRLAIIWADLKRRGISSIFIDCSDLKRMIVKKR